jgi:hypothetical protein
VIRLSAIRAFRMTNRRLSAEGTHPPHLRPSD